MIRCEKIRIHESEGVEFLSLEPGYARVRGKVLRVVRLYPIGWQHVKFRGSASKPHHH